MDYDLIVSTPANNDLSSSLRFLTDELDAHNAASSLIESFKNAVLRIKKNPRLYPIDEQISRLAHQEIRRCSVKNHILFYHIDAESSKIVVSAFIHSRQDAAATVSKRY